MALLSEHEIEQGLLGGQWNRDGNTVTREITFEDFSTAVAFVNRVAEAAERANHHPDILLHSWNRVRLQLSTHSEGGLTRADIELAKELDGLL